MKRKLALEWTGRDFFAAAWDKRGLLFQSRILEEGARAEPCLKNFKRDETFLILPRVFFLQREIEFGPLETENIKDALRKRAGEVFPWPLTEMAFGVDLDTGGKTRALIHGALETRIREVMKSSAAAGFEIGEIITEDQPLLWNFCQKSKEISGFWIDKNSCRILKVQIENRKIKSSRSFQVEENLDLIKEKSLPIYLSGSWTSHEIQSFGPFAEYVDLPFSAVLFGAFSYEPCRAISLLPHTEKAKKRNRMKRGEIRKFLKAVLGFVLICQIGFAMHVFCLEVQIKSFQKRTGILEAKSFLNSEKAAALEKSKEAVVSKARLLELLREISLKTPDKVRIVEIQAEDRNVFIRGEAETHGLLTETLQAFEQIQVLKEVRLEHSRMRKRLNLDCLEWEAGGLWKK